MCVRMLGFRGSAKLFGIWIDGSSSWAFRSKAKAMIPAGKVIVAITEDESGRKLRCVDLDSGREIWQRAFQGDRAVFNHDGTMIAATNRADTPSIGASTTLELISASTGRDTCVAINYAVGMIRELAFTPDGRRLATIANNGQSDAGELRLWDVDTGRELLTARLEADSGRSLHFTPDGHKLIFLGSRTGVHIWDGTPLPE